MDKEESTDARNLTSTDISWKKSHATFIERYIIWCEWNDTEHIILQAYIVIQKYTMEIFPCQSSHASSFLWP